jgi:hypothetical protein
MGFLSNVIARLVEHTADLDAHTYNPWEVLKTGEYMLTWGLGGPTTSATIAIADRLSATYPVVVSRPVTIDRLAIKVTVAATAGKKARLGIYRFGANCYPGALVKDYGEVAVDSTGIKVIDFDQALSKGLYWMVFISDGTPTCIHCYNSPSPLGPRSSDLNYKMHAFYKLAVGYGALPDPFPAGATMAADGFPAVFPRLKSLD